VKKQNFELFGPPAVLMVRKSIMFEKYDLVVTNGEKAVLYEKGRF
jgi:hypothetical protein